MVTLYEDKHSLLQNTLCGKMLEQVAHIVTVVF